MTKNGKTIEDIRNAEYIALAVSNLHILAEALERFIQWVDESDLPNKMSLYDKGTIRKAKEALNNIK